MGKSVSGHKKQIFVIVSALLVLALVCVLAIIGRKPFGNLSIGNSGYSPEARKAIEDFTALYGRDSGNYQGNAYVVRDFDNTISIFDIAYQCSIYQLETMSFAMDPQQLEAALKSDIDPDADDNSLWIRDIISAYSYLFSQYGPFTPKGLDESALEVIKKDPQWQEFSAKMRAFFAHVEDTNPEDTGYKWILYWQSGMTRQEVYDLFYRSCSHYESVPSSYVTWTSPKELSSEIGVVSCEFTEGISVPSDVKEMLSAVHDAGIDVWVCSASHLDGVRAAVDAFGLSDSITGVIGMTQKMEDGVYIPAYDFETGYPWLNKGNGEWEETGNPIRTMTALEGKVVSIENALIPMYGTGPLAGFMDSSGDFNFCTEFESMKMVICYNRANRKITDGGLVGIAATYQKEALKYDLKKANDAGDTYYLLQGRDENGLRSLRPSDETIRLEESTPKRFDNSDNDELLKYAKDNNLTTEEFFNTFAMATKASAESNSLGLDYGYLEEYRGYHAVK